MKKGLICIFSFFIIFFLTFSATRIINEKIFKPLEENSQSTTTTVTKAYKYRVSVFKGKLAVFDGEEKIPYKVYDTYIDSLPEKDKEILSEGIRVNSSSELMKIIEEYTS